MKNLADKDLKKRYGKAICDFVNAKNPVDALLTYLDNIQKIMGFSESFKKDACAKLPKLSHFHKLTAEEKEIVHSREEMEWSIERFMQTSHSTFGVEVKEINFPNVLYLPHSNKTEEPDFKSIHLDGFVETFEDGYVHEYKKKPELRGFSKRIKLNQGKIKKLKLSMQESRIEYLESKALEFGVSGSWYKRSGAFQIVMCGILQRLLEGRGFNEDKAFGLILSVYNKFAKKRTTVSLDEEGKGLIKRPILNEINYFTPSLHNPRLTGLTRMNKDLRFFLVEFLLEPENHKYLKKCEWCEQFYIAEKLNKRKFCSGKCKSHLHNQRRIESGAHARYKREKRLGGAKESYYG